MKQFLFLLLFAFSLASCSKDNDNADDSEVTKENLSGNYKLVSIKANTSFGEVDLTNNTDVLAACERDNIIQLRIDMTFAIQDAGIQCNPQSTGTGSWDLPNESTLTISNNAFFPGGGSASIVDFDGNTLKLQAIINYLNQQVPVSIVIEKQ